MGQLSLPPENKLPDPFPRSLAIAETVLRAIRFSAVAVTVEVGGLYVGSHASESRSATIIKL